MPEIHILLGYASIGMQALAALLAVVRWKYLSTPQRLLTIMLGISLVTQFLAREYAGVTGNNYPFFHAHVLIEFIFLWSIFRIHLRKMLPAWVMIGLLGVFLTAWALGAFHFQSLWEFPTSARLAESILVIAFGGLFYIQALRRLDMERIQTTFMFWVSTGLLLFFVSNLLVSMFGNLLIQNSTDAAWDAVWSVHNILNILLFISFGIAFLCADVLHSNSTK